MRIKNLLKTTAEELSTAIDQLKLAGVRDIIIDLRNNSGGKLSSMMTLSELFIDKGVLMFKTVGKHESMNIKFVSKSDASYPDVRFVILINSKTSGSAEAFAGLMQENGRAMIIGEPTSGFGVIRTHFPLSDGSSLSIPTAYLYSGKGRLIHGNPVEPDIFVESNIEDMNYFYWEMDKRNIDFFMDDQLRAAVIFLTNNKCDKRYQQE